MFKIKPNHDILNIPKKSLICEKFLTKLDAKGDLFVFIKDQSKVKANHRNIAIKSEFPLLENMFKVLKPLIAKCDFFQYGKFGTF